MNTIQVIGADRVAQRLHAYAQQLIPKVDSDVFFIGEKAKQGLQLKFPDLNVQGQFFPDTYTITIEKAGRTLSWIWCPKWHMYFKRKTDETINGQEMTNQPDLSDEIVKTLNMILDELIPKINQSILYSK